MTPLHERSAALIEELGLGTKAQVTAVTPLTGGVASDIARVELNGADICVKFALPKLKVAADWHAPVHRNAAEFAWLSFASQVCPDAALRLFGHSEDQHGFAMEFFTGTDVYLWKDALLQGESAGEEAAKVADMLGQIHAASTATGFDARLFQNRDDFRALRIEPYLSFTQQAYPNIADRLSGLADMLYQSNQVLVHGDVSPKNIMFRGGKPVLLDAECATMGDASFDPSFCMNHLALKALHMPNKRDGLLRNLGQFWDSYARHICWEPAQNLERRVCQLLPALMLARVDGKSPVEYLSARSQDHIRSISIDLISDPASTVPEFITRLHTQLKELKT